MTVETIVNRVLWSSNECLSEKEKERTDKKLELVLKFNILEERHQYMKKKQKKNNTN